MDKMLSIRNVGPKDYFYVRGSEMSIARLGNCISLWDEHDMDPRCVMGNFPINLRDLKAAFESQSKVTVDGLSVIDQYLYVKNTKANPDDKPVSQLFWENADVEVIFDPLNCHDVTWSANNRRDSVVFADEAKRLAAKSLLQANAGLQHQVKERIKQQQASYLKEKDWTHFADRVTRFWQIVYNVCFGEVYGKNIYDKENDAFESRGYTFFNDLFLINEKYKKAYLEQLYQKCGDTDPVMFSMNGELNALKEKLVELVTALDKQQEDSGSAASLNVKAISFAWNNIWSKQKGRSNDLYGLLKENFYNCMEEIEKNLFGIFFGIGTAKFPMPAEQIEEITAQISEIQGLIDKAQTEWKNIFRDMYEPAEPAVVEEDPAAEEASESGTSTSSLIEALSEFSGIPQELLIADADMFSITKQEYIKYMINKSKKRNARKSAKADKKAEAASGTSPTVQS